MIDSQLPLAWPLHTLVEGITPTDLVDHLEALAATATALVGYAHDLDAAGVSWLGHLADAHPNLRIQLIVLVYAACQTRRAHLEALLALQTQHADRLRFHLAICESWRDQPATGLLFQPAGSGHEATLVWALSRNFGLTDLGKSQLNLVFRADEGLSAVWMNWVVGLSAQATPLATHNLDIPALVPARGTEEAELAWSAYEDLLKRVEAAGAPVNTAVVDERTGAVTLQDATCAHVESLFEAAAIQLPDPTRLAIEKLYQLGYLVTTPSSGGIPPLQVPIRPEWLGDHAQRRSGSITKRTQFTVSAFTEDELKSFEKARKAPRAILEKFAFLFADSSRWMPDTARTVFERAVKSARDAGAVMLGQMIGGNASAFVEARASKIIEDATGFAREQGRDGISEETKELLRTAMTERIDKALEGQESREHAFNRVGFNAIGPDDERMWAQAAGLLLRILRYPREVKTDPFKARGFGNLDPAEIFAALDVLRDPAYQAFHKLSKSTAWADLERIMAIENAEVSAYERCQALLVLAEDLRCPR